MLFEIEGQNMTWLFADILHGVLLKEVAARGVSLLGAREGIRVGSQVCEGGAAGLRCAGMDVKVFGIALTSVGLLFDNRETGDAVQRVGLHSESGRWNLMIAAGTDSVRTCMQRCEYLLNPAELLDGEKLDGQSDIALILRGGLVDRVREEFGFCGDEM